MTEPERGGNRRGAIAGLAIAVILLVVGLWLARELTATSKMQDCLMSGRTNCNVIPAQWAGSQPERTSRRISITWTDSIGPEDEPVVQCDHAMWREPDRACLPAINHPWFNLAPMGTRPDDPKKHRPGRRRRHDDLLTIWLAYLNQLDNPVRRRAAYLRQKLRPRRDISVNGAPRVRDLGPQLYRTPLSGPAGTGPARGLR